MCVRYLLQSSTALFVRLTEYAVDDLERTLLLCLGASYLILSQIKVCVEKRIDIFDAALRSKYLCF